MDDGQGQDAPGAGAGHPVEQLPGGPARLPLQGDQQLDQHQAFDSSSVQTQEPVCPGPADTVSTSQRGARMM